MERYEVRQCSSGDGWIVWNTERDCRTDDPDMTEGAATLMAAHRNAYAEEIERVQAEIWGR
jgi:hypothetical protein